MDAGFGAPNHRCFDLSWALDITSAEAEEASSEDSASDGARHDASASGAAAQLSPRLGLVAKRRAAIVLRDNVQMKTKRPTPIAKGCLRVEGPQPTTVINTASPAEQLCGTSVALREALDGVRELEEAAERITRREERDKSSIGLRSAVLARDEGHQLVAKSAQLVRLLSTRRQSLVAAKTADIVEGRDACCPPDALSDGSSSTDDDEQEQEAGRPGGADGRHRPLVRSLSLRQQVDRVVQQSDTITNVERLEFRRRNSSLVIGHLPILSNATRTEALRPASALARGRPSLGCFTGRPGTATVHNTHQAVAPGSAGRPVGVEKAPLVAAASANIIVTSQAPGEGGQVRPVHQQPRGMGVWLVPPSGEGHCSSGHDEDDVTAEEIFAMLRDDADSFVEQVEKAAAEHKKNADRLRLPSSDPGRHIVVAVGSGNRQAGLTYSRLAKPLR
jgi:hypothetical protein